MKLEDAKVWLYRVQQRLAITRSEATALLALTALLLAGMVVRYAQEPVQATPGTRAAATDHRFQAGAARLRAAQEKQEETDRPASTAEARTPPPSSNAPMDLNGARPAQLERLPGVGPVIAGRIAAYRRDHGPLAEVAHLERVSGIGPKTMARLTPLLTTETPGATTKADAAKADTAADTPTDAGTHAP